MFFVARSLGHHTNSKRLINSRLRFGQGWPNIMFLWHVYVLVSSYCSVYPYSGVCLNKTTGNLDVAFFFNTITLPCFNYLYDIFHIDQIKVVPTMIYDLLTPVGLAYLIMGDGSFHKRDGYVVLCTEGFTNPDNLRFLAVLIQKFGLSCRTERHGERMRIVIRRESVELLRSLVLSHMIPEMKYRVGS